MALRAKGMTDEEIESLALDVSPTGSPPAAVAASSSPAAAELGNMLSRRASHDPPTDQQSRRPSAEIPEARSEAHYNPYYGLQRAISGSSSPGMLSESGHIMPRRPSHQRSFSSQTNAEESQYASHGDSWASPSAVPHQLSHQQYPGDPAYASGVPGYGASSTVSSAPGFGSTPASYGYEYTTSPITSRRSTVSSQLSGENPRYLSATGTEVYPRHTPSPSEMDMSELLSPELQAHFTAVLEQQALEGSSQAGPSWSYPSQRQW